MKVLDLFSGIGGFSLGLEAAGFETVAFCEIDPFCRQVLKKHWPEVPIHEDITKLDGAAYRGAVDVVCGGFPCQDISWAWPGKGLQGERSGLWFEYHRIINEAKPKYAIIENVGNLRTRGLRQIITSLAAIGYICEWATIPASSVGAPHQRDRIWIIAHREWEPVVFASDLPRCELCEEPFCTYCQKHYSECSCIGPHSEDDGWSIQKKDWGLVAYPDLSGRKEQRRAITISEEHIAHELYCWWEAEPPVLRVDNGFPGRVDRIKALGNAVVPQVVEMIGRAIMEADNANL